MTMIRISRLSLLLAILTFRSHPILDWSSMNPRSMIPLSSDPSPIDNLPGIENRGYFARFGIKPYRGRGSETRGRSERRRKRDAGLPKLSSSLRGSRQTEGRKHVHRGRLHRGFQVSARACAKFRKWRDTAARSFWAFRCGYASL